VYLRGVCHGDNRDQQVSGVSHSAIAGQTGLMSTAAETNRYYIDTDWLVPAIHTFAYSSERQGRSLSAYFGKVVGDGKACRNNGRARARLSTERSARPMTTCHVIARQSR
jgi:hypothetical protein